MTEVSLKMVSSLIAQRFRHSETLKLYKLSCSIIFNSHIKRFLTVLNILVTRDYAKQLIGWLMEIHWYSFDGFDDFHFYYIYWPEGINVTSVEITDSLLRKLFGSQFFIFSCFLFYFEIMPSCVGSCSEFILPVFFQSFYSGNYHLMS